jgi:DNA ligase-1
MKSAEYEKTLKELSKKRNELNEYKEKTYTISRSVVFVTWDIVDFTSTIPYKERIERLTGANIGSDKIRVLKTIIVNSVEEAQAFFEKCLDAGEEGAMIKNIKAVWVPKRTKDLGKMKAEEVADLKIVSVQEGSGKYTGMVGAYICETSDGKLSVGVGTGLSDEDRKNPLSVGTVIEVMYNQLISDKKTGKHSLFLPRFMSVRVDKDVANSFDELK